MAPRRTGRRPRPRLLDATARTLATTGAPVLLSATTPWRPVDGRIGVTPEALRSWAGGLRANDAVALEATGNSDAIANLLMPLVARVVVSNPTKTRAIAEAKVKTDKVDARILAQLLAADFLPPVWLPDDRTRGLQTKLHRWAGEDCERRR